MTHLRELRCAAGMTQAQLAAELQVSLQTVKFWEAGRNPCAGPAEVLLRMLDEQAKGEQ